MAMREINIVDLINAYNSGRGVESLAKEYHVGKLKIRQILKDNNVVMKSSGGVKKNKDYKISDWRIKKYDDIPGYHYVAKYKADGKVFSDYENLGGFLTSYIKEKEGINIPSLYERRKYYMKTGNYWWEQWFDIISIENKGVKKCPYCNWETIDIENRGGSFEQHLLKEHNKTIEDYLNEFPDDKSYFKTYLLKKEKENKLKNQDNFIVCPICGDRLEKMTYWHLKNRHNMGMHDFKNLYPDAAIMSKSMKQQTLHAISLGNLTVSKDRFISCYERELQDFISSYGINFETNRQILIGKEIDILIPDKKIGIEFDGLKFHTEWFGKKNHKYHLDKTIKCNEKGYGLIHIFEDEYVNNKNIVLHKISHILGLDKKLPRIYARRCIVKEIYKYEAETFLNKYHIQGFASSSIYLGAFYNNDLIAVMTFKNGNVKNACWDLTRFATNYDYICCGIGGKMFNYFIKNYNPEKIISFADRRWTIDISSNLYTKLGFTIEKIGSPDYRYYNERVDRYKRIHKMTFSKNALHKKYGFPLSMTETEMAKELGYDRIWDCGLIKYVWKKETSE